MGHETVVFDNLSRGHREVVKYGHFMQGDISQKPDLDAVFNQYPIDAVVHLAAYAYVGESVLDPQKYYQNNVVGTITLLDAMMAHGVKKIIFSSTCSVYGTPSHVPISEEQSKKPINPYGWTKYIIERILLDYDAAYGLKSVVLRYFNAAGADPEGEIGEWHLPETHLIPLIFNTVLKKQKNLEIFGDDYPTPDGTCVRDYIHVADIAKAHCLALNYLDSIGTSDVFNLGSGKGCSVREVVGEVEKCVSSVVPVVVSARRPGDPATLTSSSLKALKLLGWKPESSDLGLIVKSGWDWHRKMPSLLNALGAPKALH